MNPTIDLLGAHRTIRRLHDRARRGGARPCRRRGRSARLHQQRGAGLRAPPRARRGDAREAGRPDGRPGEGGACRRVLRRLRRHPPAPPGLRARGARLRHAARGLPRRRDRRLPLRAERLRRLRESRLRHLLRRRPAQRPGHGGSSAELPAGVYPLVRSLRRAARPRIRCPGPACRSTRCSWRSATRTTRRCCAHLETHERELEAWYAARGLAGRTWMSSVARALSAPRREALAAVYARPGRGSRLIRRFSGRDLSRP